MGGYAQIMQMYLSTMIVIAALSITGIIIAAKITMKGADKISRNIADGMADRVERNIKRDIDNGRFFY